LSSENKGRKNLSTSSFERRMTAGLRTFLFCLPLAALFGPPALVLWAGGELMSPDRVAERQARRDRLVLHGAAYTNSAIYVKMQGLARRAPQVLALGSSRTMQFRAGFFLPTVSFYNAGGTVARLIHFRGVLQRLPPERQPEALLIATDPYFFHPSFDKGHHDALGLGWLREQMDARPTGGEVFLADWWTVWRDIVAGKVDRDKLLGGRGLSDRIGLNAVCREQGFRNDGSYLYGSANLDITQPRHRDYRFVDTLKQVSRGTGRFAYGSEVSAAGLRELKALLEECRARSIHVVGFLPPYPHEVWSAMENLGPKYNYLWSLPASLRTAFEQHGFEFYDFSDFAWLGAPDSEAIDGFHGSERTYLRLLISMLEQGSQLNRYASLSQLQQILATAKSHTNIVPEALLP
jgi:hypothetical protein